MALQRLAIGVDDRERAHLIAGALGEVMLPAPVALSVFENADVWLVEALYTERPAADEFAIRIGQVLAIDPPACRVEEVAERNWVALSQAALPPVYAGRFTIFGSHDVDQVARGPNAIMVDAGEAFGTAHHATTYGCLLAIDQLVRRRRFKNVLDLGTGSGVLAIALCRALPKARILASDNDRRSIEVAIDNARRNHCMGHNSPTRLHFTHASGVSAASVRSFQPFDLIVANILAKPIVGFAPDIAAVSRNGSNLVLSGLLVEQAAGIIATYRSHGFVVCSHVRIENWSTITFERRQARSPD
ncbi:MAG: 50S ribosomal protein L11 methyltransferase [Hyphomicrobiaceae bacterium]